ncbi:tRNA (adenosine(37)-N6)-dimethylallyltransferase MiaA [Lachnotalea sp. AF33-28]|uniref:tRNA (adenosine(37)-N6)-dimethylallyltransferase MiaA n=1 Tax=Lachnotalea sp. AF33-28 TaxID=2292046 RepID=UPI000E54FE04|nr:tRNA (adenosine(37)-N6)-dimethylallyltransferase MiaA [Lachnotalea sp. AF33-28]RHP29887.1 tRNA (adenosine(37)-N6)-dimethylallyltransferase MiaA [Lachnotalea sp. AF33-28]
MKPPLIVLTGPTAVGKTALSIELARALNGEIISADSMQVYRCMDIGSAKVTPEEMQGIRHYLIDELDPSAEFNVVRFKQMAKKALEEIYSRGKLPIVAGGTGFYIQALLKDVDFTETCEDPALREELENLAKERGVEYLHGLLERADPAAASSIHANNVKRVIRALEFNHLTGEQISRHNAEESRRESPYNYLYFVLTMDRARLYERIERRVDAMMAAGLLEEVEMLKQIGCHRQMVSMQGLGYKELLSFLDGDCTLEEAVSVIKRDTRHFAKRQLTWFRREEDVIWIDKDRYPDEDAVLAGMLEIIRKRFV